MPFQVVNKRLYLKIYEFLKNERKVISSSFSLNAQIFETKTFLMRWKCEDEIKEIVEKQDKKQIIIL